MNILITGGCGFIGSHLVEYYLNKGDHVTVVDDLSTGFVENILPFRKNTKFIFVKADILTWIGLEKAVKSAEIIYHMAAVIGVYRVLKEPINVIDTNVLGCARLLNAIYKNHVKPRVLIASSSSVYGHCKQLLLTEKNKLNIKTHSNPLSIYAISKIFSEEMGIIYYREMNIPITIIRFFNVIGPRQVGDYGMVIPRFIKNACNNEPIIVYGNGSQTRSFCDVRDVVIALVKLIKNIKSHGEIINVGNDNEISITDIAELIRSKANSQSDIQYLSYRKAYNKKFSDIQHRRPDLSKFYEMTHHKNKWSLEKTIENLISLYKSSQP